MRPSPRSTFLACALLSAVASAPVQADSQHASHSAVLHDGVLSAASTRSASEIASQYVADQRAAAGQAPMQMRVAATQPALGASIVRLRPTVGGLDVVGADQVIRLDAKGRVRWARTSVLSLPSNMKLTPGVDARAALNSVGALDRAPERHSGLVILAHPALFEARLVWELRHADQVAIKSYRSYVDAQTGALLWQENLVASAQKHRANVFATNPVVDNEETTLSIFSDLPESATTLEDNEVQMLNCIDTRSCREVKTIAGNRNLHYCETRPLARPTADNSFTHISRASDTDPEDPFAEVQGYHHVKTALENFRFFSGDPDFALKKKLQVVVNHRIPDLTSTDSRCDGNTANVDSQLTAEDNAYFWPAGDIGPTDLSDRILMSQGLLSDWSYDGEVVYHELTHAVMHSVTPLAWYHHDELGIDYSPGGLHEGFSDYFSATMSGNAELAVYAGTTEEDGPTALGNLLEFKRCTDALVGEEHDESLAWSNAMWMIRRSLRSQAKRDIFDAALFRVISSLDQFDGFEEAAALVLAELNLGAEQFIDDEGLAAAEAVELRDTVAAARDKLDERALFGCNNRTKIVRPGESTPELYLRGPNTLGLSSFAEQIIPAGMQFELVLDKDTTGIKLVTDGSFELVDEIKASTMKRVPRMVMLIKPGDEAIHWTWNLPDGEHDATMMVDLDLSAGEFASASAVALGDFPAGRYHVQLANVGADWGLDGLVFQVADENGDFGDSKRDDLGEGTGGGCNSSNTPISGSGALALLLALLVERRRRGARASQR